MPWPAIEAFRKWTAKRRRLLQGLLGVAVEGVASCVPGGGLAVWSTRIVGEFAKHGVDRLTDTSANVPDVKPAGQSIPAEQLDQLNGWLASLSTSYATLLDRLDALVTVRDDEPQEQLQKLLRQTLSQNAELARDFDAHAEETRRQTLSLAHIEERLDDILHGQKGIALSLEEIKALLLQCAAPPGEWELLRQARPESARLLIEADAHFLAGRREAGMDLLLRLMNERGVGQATLCRRLGGAWLGEGKLKEAGQCLQQGVGSDGRPTAAVARSLTSLVNSTTRGSQLPVWRSLPRGFVIEERWRIDGEVGRGGMASVYRAEGCDVVNRSQMAAIKVPAPGLLDDAASQQRLVEEIQISLKLSRTHHRAIVETTGYVRLTDPHTKRLIYGPVMEFIDGQTLAHWLAQRQANGKPLSLKEIQTILESVCAALEVPFTEGLKMKFAWVPPGRSWLGGGDGKQGTQEFTLAKGLWCGVYPTTQAEWQAVMGNNPSHFAGHPRNPVERVSWGDAQEFLKKLNTRLADSGLTYRLPTTEEWEFICRGGSISQTQSAYHFYFARSKTDLTSVPTNDLSSQQANFDGTPPTGSASKGPYLQATCEVGLYLPNPLGIYDLHGNVWEWTSTLEGSSRVIRGGCWSYNAGNCAASARRGLEPGYRNGVQGFRVLAVPSGAK